MKIMNFFLLYLLALNPVFSLSISSFFQTPIVKSSLESKKKQTVKNMRIKKVISEMESTSFKRSDPFIFIKKMSFEIQKKVSEMESTSFKRSDPFIFIKKRSIEVSDLSVFFKNFHQDALQCVLCKKYFMKKFAMFHLEKHIGIVSFDTEEGEENLFKCRDCGEAFVKTDDLVAHLTGGCFLKKMEDKKIEEFFDNDNDLVVISV